MSDYEVKKGMLGHIRIEANTRYGDASPAPK